MLIGTKCKMFSLANGSKCACIIIATSVFHGIAIYVYLTANMDSYHLCTICRLKRASYIAYFFVKNTVAQRMLGKRRCTCTYKLDKTILCY